MKTSEIFSSPWMKYIVFSVALIATAFIYGAVPFFTLPTLWQVLWTSGFAQSFVNDGWPTIYATFFGYPSTVPIAFGLPGAFLQSTLMTLGLAAAPAYSLMACIYLGLALWGAYAFARRLGLRDFLALLMALAWVSTPIIWAHARYSMLSLGLALLPFYLFSAQLVCQLCQASLRDIFFRVIAFFAVCVLAVFMDGYSYMMFLCGIGVLFMFAFIDQPDARKSLLRISLPCLSLGVIFSYLLYIAFIGQTSFQIASMDTFRGYGVDLTMLFIPTQQVHWLWDFLGLSVPRIRQDYFGNSSVFVTTFSAVFILFGIVGFCLTKKRHRWAYPLLLLALFGTYMALGPSLKINSTRPNALVSAGNIANHSASTLINMPKEYALFRTGSEVLSKYLPGFKYMRMAHRWMGLGLFGFWALIVLMLVDLESKNRWALAVALPLFLIVSNLPKPGVEITANYCVPKKCLNSFNAITRDLADTLSDQIKPNSIATFITASDIEMNGFIVNYLSSFAHFKTYNIGGDKNLTMAQEKWPIEIKYLLKSFSNPELFFLYMKEALVKRESDYMIIPFFNLYRYSFIWPPKPSDIELVKNLSAAVLTRIKADSNFKVVMNRYYALVSLSPEAKTQKIQRELKNYKRFNIGESLPVQVNYKFISTLAEGWGGIKSDRVLSKNPAKLSLVLDRQCRESQCHLKLNFKVFASLRRPVVVNFYTKSSHKVPVVSVKLSNEQIYSVNIPIRPQDLIHRDEFVLDIKVHRKKSLFSLKSLFSSNRGISLRSLSLEASDQPHEPPSSRQDAGIQATGK